MGLVGAVDYVPRRAPDLAAHRMTLRRLHDLHRRSWLSWWRPCSRWWTSARRSPKRWPDWTARGKCCSERPEDDDPRRTVRSRHRSAAMSSFDNVTFAYDAGKPVLHGISFDSASGHRHRAGGPLRLRQIHHHRPDRGVPRAQRAAKFWWMASISPPCGWIATARSSAWCCRTRSCSTAPFAKTSPSRGPDATEEQILEACRIARVDEFAEQLRRRLRHHRRRARRQTFRRPAPARLHRARHPRRPAHSDSGRSHLQPRLRIRSAHSGRPVAT